MGKKVPTPDYSDDEAEARATAALRRALSTPYKPQSDLRLGTKSKPKKRRAKKTPASA